MKLSGVDVGASMAILDDDHGNVVMGVTALCI